MGLDMFLHVTKYINTDDVHVKGEKVPCEVYSITYEAGYWRKANHIHAWFVDNVQGGEDECHPHGVTVEQLLELERVCENVKRNRALAPELLPTRAGFFFGGTAYDEFYFKDIERTLEIITRAIALAEDPWSEIVYRSSW